MTTTCITLAEYQSRTGETQTESAKDYRYLRHGLMSECGEVAGVYAKMIRDHGGQLTDAAREAFKKELGDCAWFVARMTRDLEQLLVEYAEDEAEAEEGIDIGDWVAEIVYWSSRYWISDRNRALAGLWFGIKRAAECLGFTMEEVMLANLAKLADRKQRGVIGGSGNDR